MENFEYVDIFATKGIEYIIAVIFLVILIFFWRYLNKDSAVRVAARSGTGTVVSLVDWFNLADNYYYHQGHSWLSREQEGRVRVGIDDFAQKLLGPPQKVELPQIGSQVKQGETGMQIKIDGKYVDFLSPVDGKVLAVNRAVIQSPHLINKDPYNSGWLFEVKADKLASNLKNLLQGNVAKVWIQETVNRLSSTITGNRGVVLQDGGTIRSGFVKELAPDTWEQLVKDFFLTGEL